MKTPPSALLCFDEIAASLDGKRLLLGLDFDGVLAPIVKVIPSAEAGAATRRVLRRLLSRRRANTAIVTGRRLSEIKRKLPMKGLAYSGNHGLEIETGSRRWLHPKAKGLKPHLPGLIDSLEAAMAPYRGAEIERKDISCSLHFRKCAPSAAVAGMRAALRVVRASRAPVRWHTGKRVVEIQPRARWDKGDAFRVLHDRLGGTPIFLGDDAGDEGGFETARKFGGFGVRVSPSGPTRAAYSIPSQRMVVRFLERIDALLKK